MVTRCSSRCGIGTYASEYAYKKACRTKDLPQLVHYVDGAFFMFLQKFLKWSLDDRKSYDFFLNYICSTSTWTNGNVFCEPYEDYLLKRLLVKKQNHKISSKTCAKYQDVDLDQILSHRQEKRASAKNGFWNQNILPKSNLPA